MSRALWLFVLLLAGARAVAAQSAPPRLMWDRAVSAGAKDVHVAFRGTFEQAAAGDVEVRLLGAAWFVVWIDGRYLADGPSRFQAEYPQYQTHPLHLGPGRHTLAVQVAHIGVSTRLLENIAPFLYCVVHTGSREVPVHWKCSALPAYASQVRRINPQLAFVEWCDTRQLPNWQAPEFGDAAWQEPATVNRTIGPMLPLSTDNVRSVVHVLTPLASGSLVAGFGYERDDPPARFCPTRQHRRKTTDIPTDP